MFYRGFDADEFPGLDTMKAVKPCFDFVGFYLPAPSHADKGWCGQRPALLAQGWGLLPIFVGQETVGPGSHVVTYSQGVADAALCARHMENEGFPAGSRVFLDLENGPPFGKGESEYVGGWVEGLAAQGFAPGIYCSHLIADLVAAANPSAQIWAFKVPTTATENVAPPFAAPDPSGSGHVGAAVWQYRQNCRLALGATRIYLDLNSSRTADPSAP